MDKDNDKKVNKSFSRMITTIILSSVFVLLLVFTMIPIFAWYYTGKDIYSYAPISTPESLYIGTGHEDDVRYLDISGIDLTNPGSKEYVISISGKGVTHYLIQIGYTTNNSNVQYNLYSANEWDGQGDKPEGITYIDSKRDEYVYTKVSNTPIEMDLVNFDYGVQETYEMANSQTYSHIESWAKPIYKQTHTTIETGQEDVYTTFFNYFILEIKWDTSGVNNRETDILCIAASASAG